jgi:hypothetical protein
MQNSQQLCSVVTEDLWDLKDKWKMLYKAKESKQCPTMLTLDGTEQSPHKLQQS